MSEEAIIRIEKFLDQIFGKIDILSANSTTNHVLLQEIEKKFDRLPCETNTKRLTLIDQEVFPNGENSKIREIDNDIHAFKYGWGLVIAGVSLVAMILSIVKWII